MLTVRMVAMKRLARLRLLVDGVEGVAHLEMVAHAKAVHHLALRIVLLREDVIVAIGLEESLHVVILRLVGHEEHSLRSHTASTP